MTRIETVSIVYQHPRILLGMKKQRFGKGKYNGFGGGLEPGETLEECAIRETLEESGIKIINPRQMGEILFKFESEEQNHQLYFFRADDYKGEPVETNEMKPEWFNVNQIPYDDMWEDDQYWLPLLLDNRKFIGKFLFDSKHKIKNYELEEK